MSSKADPTEAPRPDEPADTPETAVARLAGAARPFLIGVRHHAPSLAAAVPALLDAARPDVVLVELPEDLQDWIPWLGHPETQAPVALAGAGANGLGFYPFADFSPELAAVRWAARHGVPVVACDLPLRLRGWAEGVVRADRVVGSAWSAGADDSAGAAGADGVAGPAGAPERGSGAPGLRSGRTEQADPAGAVPEPGPAAPPGFGLRRLLGRHVTGRDGDDLWDRLVEAAAPGSSPEAVRRAALMVGWALRRDAEADGVDHVDLLREEWMRRAIRAATADGKRAAAVIGAFHAPALLGLCDDTVDFPAPVAGEEAVVTSLVPYTYALLDERSGYPAGIRDPEWQHDVCATGGDPAELDALLIRTATRICAEVRTQGHPSGPADAREVVRLAGDLARLRGLPAAGRGELLEAVQTVLTHGEPLGRGRAVARALERVLVGTRAGRPAPQAPRSGLGPAVESELAELGLPGPHIPDSAEERDLRLDPMRTDLDRRRELLLRRLAVCRVPYAESVEVVGTGGADALTTRWRVRWSPSTAAMLDVAGIRGVTAEQAAEGILRDRRRREQDEGGPTAAQVLSGLEQAAECGLTALTRDRMHEADAILPDCGTLPELLAGITLLDRIRADHFAGLDATGTAPGKPASARPAARAVVAGTEPNAAGAGLVAGLEVSHEAVGKVAGGPLAALAVTTSAELTAAAVRRIDGLAGTEDPADAQALVELARRADEFGGVRLADALARLAKEGAPLIAAAAGAVRVLLGHEEPDRFGIRVASWLDDATTPDRRADLVRRLTGALTAAGPLLAAGGAALDPLLERVSAIPDADFLTRLPALRGGFETLAPAARDRLLAVIEERLDRRIDAETAESPEALAAWTAADLTARGALTTRGLWPLTPVEPARDATGASTSPATSGATPAAVARTPAAAVPDAGAEAGTLVAAVADPDSAAGTEPGAKAVAAVPPALAATEAGAVVHAAPAEADAEAGTDAGVGLPAADIDAAVTDTDTEPGAGAPAVLAAAEVGAGAAVPAPLDVTDAPNTLAPAARWRLVLGRRAAPGDARTGRLGAALDELYGAGRGEGSRGNLGGDGQGGGREAAFPSVRLWGEELAALFGPGVREEVLAAAVAAGRRDAMTELDPHSVRPSVDLLRAVLEHAGGLPESRVAALRPLVARIVEELTRELATRMRPALSGVTVPRPSRRPGGGLDLPRTIRANLATARRNDAGDITVIPEKPIFRTKARRSADWRLILVVDVSGSMEASTIWSALTASILAGVPALTTHFVAFSTEVMDFTEQVHDPLGLLLEVSVGGGTHIAAGLRYARDLVTVPSRTLIAVVSDFEEGWPLGGLLGEVRALVGAGCHVLGCASLDDRGKPRYSTAVAAQLVAAGMPVAALSPTELARWVGEKVR